MIMGFLMSPVSEAKAVELFFESPVDGSLTKSRTPSVRLRLNNYQGQGDSKLTLDVGGQNASECSFDPAVGVAHCSLINPLSDGLQTINAVLTSSGDYVASATISIAVDGDEDAIPNHEDACANTPLSETVDNQGCALSQLDSDGDGISDGEEVGAGSDPENAGSYPPVVINAFAALPERISKAGDSAGLSWVVQGATSVTLINDVDTTRLTSLPSMGTARVSPRINTTYTLQAEGPGGVSDMRIPVTIVSVPPESAWDPYVMDEVPESIGASLTVTDDGAVYLGAFDGNYYRFTPNGTLDWAIESMGVVMNKAAVSNGRVIVGTSSASGGRILSLKPNQSLEWDVHTPSGIVASPIVNSDATRVYASTYDGIILGLSTTDGSELWRYELPDGETVSASPTLSEDGTVLYVHTNNHQVFAVGTSSPSQPALVGAEGAQSQSSSPVIWQKDIRSTTGQ